MLDAILSQRATRTIRLLVERLLPSVDLTGLLTFGKRPIESRRYVCALGSVFNLLALTQRQPLGQCRM